MPKRAAQNPIEPHPGEPAGAEEPRGRIRLKPDERRALIVKAAFRAIAEEGFEGLRTREIATAAEINSATLHHYIPTKQDLIDGVAQHLLQRLQTEKAPRAAHEAPDDFDPFDHQFEDLIFYQLQAPDVLAVYREFVGRAPRDPTIRALVAKLHASWKASIADALREAQARGALRLDLDIEASAGLVVSTAWGLVAQIFVSEAEVSAAAKQLRSLMRRMEA